jgi:hypothetical protein
LMREPGHPSPGDDSRRRSQVSIAPIRECSALSPTPPKSCSIVVYGPGGIDSDT